MAQINARDWIFETSSDGGTTNVEIDGLTGFTLNPTEGEESADTTTFKSQGNQESQAMQRGATLQVNGRKLDVDPGQTAVEDAAELVGDESLVSVRFRHVSQTEWTVWTAWVSLAEQAGDGPNAKTGWGATFHRSGPATTAPTV